MKTAPFVAVILASAWGLAAQTPTAGRVRVSPQEGSDYVFVPPGGFEMGCVAGESACQADEKPAHRVELTRGFWMERTEVTLAAFGKLVAARAYRTTAESDGWSRAFDGRSLVKKEGVT